jgi:hypothetical protein
VLTAEPAKQHDLICLGYAGSVPDVAQFPHIDHAEWQADGRFDVQIGETLISVAPLAANAQDNSPLA